MTKHQLRQTVQRFYVECPGEKDAGISPATAVVEYAMHNALSDDVNFVKECLRQCFVEIFADKRVSVMTDAELAARDEAEKDYSE